MSKEFVDIAVSYGIFGALFIWLLWWTIKENKARENSYVETIKDSQERELKYIDIINNLSIRLDMIKVINDDVEDIKSDIKEIKINIKK